MLIQKNNYIPLLPYILFNLCTSIHFAIFSVNGFQTIGTVSSKAVICSRKPGQSDTGSGKSEGALSRLQHDE